MRMHILLLEPRVSAIGLMCCSFSINEDHLFPLLSSVVPDLPKHCVYSISTMATQTQQQSNPVVPTTKHSPAHPFCALGSEEILYTSELIRSLWPDKTDLRFKTITFHEPPKVQLLSYLEAEHNGNKLPDIDRKAFVCYYIRNTVSGDVPYE